MSSGIRSKKEGNCKGYRTFGVQEIFYMAIDMIFMYLIKYGTCIFQNMSIHSAKSVRFAAFKLHFDKKNIFKGYRIVMVQQFPKDAKN